MLKFEELQSLVAMCTSPERPSPYRTLYGIQPNQPARQIVSRAEWEALPFMTKDLMIATPFEERLFAARSAVDHVRATSGTSGKPPLFCPRTHVRGMDYRFDLHDFKNAFLAFTVPLMPHWHEKFMEEHGCMPRVVVHDPKNTAASVRIAKAAGVDGISVFVYHIITIGEEMKKVGMNGNIRLLEVTGETCSRMQFEYMRATFPNAKIVQSYNSSEVEDAHIGMPCHPMTGEDPLAVYHGKKTHLLELIDPDTGAVVAPTAGAEGDLLITAYPGEPSVFPLIRYRIGDTVRIVEDNCPHGTWSFTVLGRTEMDFVKISGGVLRADEVARVLRLYPGLVSDRFELHCTERNTPQGPLIEPVLYIEVKRDIDMDSFAADVSRTLRVAPEYSYDQGVSSGRYLPLTCKLLTPISGSKNKRIVMHL